MISSSSVAIDAPSDLVWDVFTDVEHWPDWTASVTRLRGLDDVQLAVGRRFERRLSSRVRSTARR